SRTASARRWTWAHSTSPRNGTRSVRSSTSWSGTRPARIGPRPGALPTVYEIKPYVRDFRSQVAGLQRHLWNGSLSRNTAYLAWKYEQNPYLPDPLIYLAVDQGKVVGMRGVFGSCWEIGTERFVVPCADDFVIAPAHRQRGLFGRIMSAAVTDLV